MWKPLKRMSACRLICFLWTLVQHVWMVSSLVPTSTSKTKTWTRGNQKNVRPRSVRVDAFQVLDDLWKTFSPDDKGEDQTSFSPGVKFLTAINNKDIDEAMKYIAGDDYTEFEYEDTDFPGAWTTPQELERNLRLQSEIASAPSILIDESIYDASSSKSGVAFRLQALDGSTKKGAAFFELNESSGLIQKAFLVKENDKSGETSLNILRVASNIISASKGSVESSSKDTSTLTPPASMTLPEQYFYQWNRRDMTQAVSVFAENVEYDDTAFPKPFSGKDALDKHLKLCATAMPSSFAFLVDDKIIDDNKIMLRWHVENDSEELPFTRGCSWYNIENGRIVQGTDLKEPAVFKTGGFSLFFNSFLSKIQEEPIRLIPTVVWVTYMYVVFFSTWFYGLPATSLEVRTWEEVRDLSLNFFLVSPILDLPFAPVVHPGLEGIFNLLLSWAAMFAGFLSDDRRSKPNVFPMLPTVAGMQFLTSAFLLPYLATRSTEPEDPIVPEEDVTTAIFVAENRVLGLAMGIVGTGSIFWGLFAREEDFGDLPTRYASLIDLLSIDRVGSSFLVDLAIFGLFQGWMVDDDAKRRGMDLSSPLVQAAKFFPFFGLALYLFFREELVVTKA